MYINENFFMKFTSVVSMKVYKLHDALLCLPPTTQTDSDIKV